MLMTYGPSCGSLLANMHLAALELDHAVPQREDRVIAADADVEAGVILRAALADDDPAGGDELPAIHLHASILRIAVAAILARAAAFLMCHKSPCPSEINARGGSAGRRKVAGIVTDFNR